jgi:diacylglycerol O-acyltransferase / wax synthase
MTQKHMDRLSAVDSTFLHQEDANSHMQIGGIAILEGKPPPFEEFCSHIERRLHLVPRYRQKLAFPPYQAGRPLWIDDPTFNLEYHVRHTALPSPGDEERLLRLTARIFSQQLDRNKPLWELYLVEGMRENSWALLTKTHHSLVDGVSGAELLTVLFDLSPDDEPAPDGSAWRPHPQPSTPEILAAGARDLVGAFAGLAGQALGATTSGPRTVIKRAREAVEGLGEVAWAIANPAPTLPQLNLPIGPHRRFAVVRGQLEDYKLVKNTFGGTVNDVVLTVVGGALERFLRGRGVRTKGLVLRVMVPVSTRTSDQNGALGNRIAVMLARLPVYIADPIERLEWVRNEMDGLKRSKQVVGADLIAGLQAFAPPTLLAQASRLAMSSRMYNLLVTNVPGPQFPVYMLGRRLRQVIPVPFLAPDHALAIAIMSYDGGINFGLLGDFDHLDDLDVVRDGIADELAELVALARNKAADEPRDVASVAAGGDGDGRERAARRSTPRRTAPRAW